MYKADRSSIHTIGALKEKNKTMKQLIFKTKTKKRKTSIYMIRKRQPCTYRN